jgi:hypothetical protein
LSTIVAWMLVNQDLLISITAMIPILPYVHFLQLCSWPCGVRYKPFSLTSQHMHHSLHCHVHFHQHILRWELAFASRDSRSAGTLITKFISAIRFLTCYIFSVFACIKSVYRFLNECLSLCFGLWKTSNNFTLSHIFSTVLGCWRWLWYITLLFSSVISTHDRIWGASTAMERFPSCLDSQHYEFLHRIFVW